MKADEDLKNIQIMDSNYKKKQKYLEKVNHNE